MCQTYFGKTARVIHVIPSDKGGGAQSLVSEVVNDKRMGDLCSVVYFSGFNSTQDNQHVIYLDRGSRSPLVILDLRKYFKAMVYKYDTVIIHSHLTWSLFYVALASVGLKVRLLYTEHSTFNKRRHYPFMKFLDRLAYSRYSSIIGISSAVSKSLADWLGKDFSEKILTISNGSRMYALKYRAKFTEDKKLKLLSVGSLKDLKGYDTAIKAISRIKDSVEIYTLVGEGPAFDKLKKIAADYNVDDLVNFVGWSDCLESFYHDADVLLIPSHWEGFSLVAVEGMSTGLPVIASNVDGLNEVVTKSLESSILIDEFINPELWANAILQMKSKVCISGSEMTLASRRQSEKYNIHRMLVSYFDLYKKLINF